MHFDWPLRQLDASNAFLYGNLEEEVFMEQPIGFSNPSQPHSICTLHKAFYGLKQAQQVPHAWFHKLTLALLNLDVVAFQVDYLLFTFHYLDIYVFLLVYVNNIIIIGSNLSLLCI